ncbi:hypothetical protein CRN65_27635 (plasmid) [Klebsiella pneumoniae]|nr:hypothetical protein CRN65_27635 [Klebsiella pneumoniae]
MLKLNDRVLIQLYLCNPLNPDYIGAPWGSDKDAESIIRANRDKAGKFKANIQNWKTSGTGSLGSPVVGKSYSSGDVDTYSVSFGKEKYNVLYNRKKTLLLQLMSMAAQINLSIA